MEPPSLSDREQLKSSKSTRDERIAFAKKIGNHKGNSYRFREAIIRTMPGVISRQGESRKTG